MDAKLLEILVCPLCKSPLVYRKAEQELICRVDHLAFAIKDGIPVMLVDEARQITAEEVKKHTK
ncbi:MAG: Trm112 family protein [Candidatus Nitrotoga sp.]